MRVVVTGAAGLFGYGLARMFAEEHEVYSLTHQNIEITDRENVDRELAEIQPELIVNPAGIADLDVCDADTERARAVNVDGVRNLVAAAREIGAAVAHISTDAVFDGAKGAPYVESDPPNPQTVYGRTKAEAERVVAQLPRHWVFRVSVLFGPGKANFISKGLDRLRRGEQYVVAADQRGTATYTLDAAAKIMEVTSTEKYGLYHVCNRGECTRYQLAVKAAELAGRDAALVVGKPAEKMGRRARRLKYAVMDTPRLREEGFGELRSWEEALREYVRP